MFMSQDDFYLSKEANDFYDRWYENDGKNYKHDLRVNKKSILSCLMENTSIERKRVLEVGCFIGDLLNVLKQDFSCDIYGVETSSKACAKCSETFGFFIENSSFSKSSIFNLSQNTKSSFDLLIFDDVLSWMSRGTILQVLAVADWLLADGGVIFIRDFSPPFSFAFENHHQKGLGIYNFKQSHGHKKFFLESGMYYEKYTKIFQNQSLQTVITSRPDSMTWADTILIKNKDHLFPILEM
jgi:SAM-dependent methyltransferase